MQSSSQCCLGKYLEEECDKVTYSRQKGRVKKVEILQSDLKLLCKRTSYEFQADDEICYHHEKVYLSWYKSLQIYCCDPYKRHNKKINKSLQSVNDSISEHFNMKPGQKLCTNCLKFYEKEIEIQRPNQNDSGDNAMDVSFEDPNLSRSLLNKSTSLLGISPMKVVGKRDRKSYGKQKVKKIKQNIENLVLSAYSIDESELSSSNEDSCSNCQDFECLISLLKEKVSGSAKREQVKILTLVPES